MAINKKFIHFKTFSNFNSKKLSANEGNTAYTEGLNGEIKTGAPEILYQSICYIQDVQKQWTHGQLYDFERVQPDNEIWYTSSDESVVYGNFVYAGENWELTNTYTNGIGIMRFKHPITHINEEAFSSSKLTSIIMPKSLESIGARAFYNCGNLETVYLPKSCQSIGNYAFYHCLNLKNIDISNIYELGDYAFEYTRIETINFKCLEVAYGAFNGCQNLKTIVLPEGLDTIGGIAFYGSYFTSSLVIPTSVTTIGAMAFQIIGLKEVYLKSLTPPTIPTPPQSGEYLDAPFRLDEPDLKIYVPYESLDTYKNAVGWKKYKDKIIAQVNSGNLKTINGTSLVGSGNIEISTGGSVDLSNYYTKEEIENKGYIVDTQLENYATKSELSKKQNILTSGTNIKTINDKTILGNGNLTITENIQSDWLGITIQDGAIKNRTHYVTGTKITVPGTYTVSGSQIYFEGKIYNLEVGTKTTLRTMPYVYATFTSDSTLVIDDPGKYTSSHPIVVVTSIKTLDDAFISDNIVRNSELEDYVTKETFESDLNNKQEILESGVNIKTINGEDILGEGDIVFNQVDWNESDETSSAYVKNRTHYAPFNRIEIPKTISSTTWTYISIPNSAGYTLYIKYTFSGQVKSAALTMSDLNVEKTLNNGPKFVVIRTTSSIGIKGDYDERHILEVSTNVVQLPEFFIPSSIARTSKLSTVATSGSYNDLTDQPNIPDEVTEDTVANWGFTKNTGTISKIKINGSTIIRQTDGIMDIGNYQVPLVSGTNIVTARGNSILQQGDLFNTTIINTNVSEILPISTGNCYMYSVLQTTPKTFRLMWSGMIYNDTITIIISTDSTITFISNTTYPILWANGTIPTFEVGTLYEISFRQSIKGWMGVAVPFTSGK